MPSKNMLPKGKRRQTVMHDYREQRTLIQEREAALRAAGETGEDIEALYDTAEMMKPVDYMSKSPFANVPGLVIDGPSGGKHPQIENTQTERRYPTPRVPSAPAPEIEVLEDLEAEDGIRSFTADPAAAGMRLDAYLAKALPDISRARVVLLIDGGQVTVDAKPARAKNKLKGGEHIEIEGDPQPAPLNATPEDIPLDIVYEDDDLAVIDKPAGMMVHAGAGSAAQNAGTLVNALLHHFGRLSGIGGALRPGIVHRLDKQTSGLIVVAKNDSTHRKLSDMFASRRLRKTYLALVHGQLEGESGTVDLAISRDLVRRIRMTTRRSGGRSAITHWTVLERLGDPRKVREGFTLVEVHIETGRTHQIRVHMQSLGHPVVGDTLYGAPHLIKLPGEAAPLELERNFLHATEIAFVHPRTGAALDLQAPLPADLVDVLQTLRSATAV